MLHPFPDTGGKCAAVLRSLDWNAHPLGEPQTWPEPLKAAVRIVLTSGFPMMVHWGPELFTFYNDAYVPSLGRKHPGNLGQPAYDWWSEMWDQLAPIFDRVLAGETVTVEDARYTPDRDGASKEAFFNHSHSPLWNTDGKIAGIFLVVTETTRRVMAERGREIEDRRSRQIMDSATDFAIVATDLNGRVTRWTKGAEAILGWTEGEMLGQSAERFFTPEDRSEDRMAFEMNCAIEAGSGNDERWHLRKSGERFWAQGRMTPLRTDGGDLAGFVKVLRDRTAERLREQRITLLGQASSGLLTASDPDAVIDFILRAGTEVLGIEQSYAYVIDPDGKHLSLAHSIGVPEEVQHALQCAPFSGPLCGIVAEKREPLVINNLQSTTVERYAVARASGITAYAGYPIAGRETLFGVISFVSLSHPSFGDEALAFFATLARFLSIGQERFDREAALNDLAISLEQRVADRTRELLISEEALRQSQKMDAVGQLTGGVAHDFNNLLTVIRGSVDLLRRENITAEKRARYIDAIADTSERAAKLTGQLLAFARRQALKPEVFNVHDRLDGIADMLDSVTGNRVKVRTEFTDDACIIRADASQFETALVNIAVNARDAMRGEGTLTITLDCGLSLPAIRGHGESPGPFVAVSLTDTGSGIPADDMARIFEPFFTTKEVGKGTGLGLSQVFGFAKQSGGDVDVTSVERQGTTFTLYLPEAEHGAVIDERHVDSDLSGEGNGLCVLVVEDNIEVGRFSTQVLDDLGYKTVWVASAEEALEKLGADGSGFDVVFSDVVMPGMGGVELAKRLAQTMPAMPIILATGYSHVLAQESAHGFELLPKPYSADQLSRMLRKVASRPSTLPH